MFDFLMNTPEMLSPHLFLNLLEVGELGGWPELNVTPLDELLRIIWGCVLMFVLGDSDLGVVSVCSGFEFAVDGVSSLVDMPLCRSDSRYAPILAPFGSVPYLLMALRTFWTSSAAT